jgi:hypothetical protein
MNVIYESPRSKNHSIGYAGRAVKIEGRRPAMKPDRVEIFGKDT